jgi:hypothetical protein
MEEPYESNFQEFSKFRIQNNNKLNSAAAAEAKNKDLSVLLLVL